MVIVMEKQNLPIQQNTMILADTEVPTWHEYNKYEARKMNFFMKYKKTCTHP